MCESLRPGMTVRPFASITAVPGPRRRRISSLVPAALILPSVMATASTNGGAPFVAILALCRMLSGVMRASVLRSCAWARPTVAPTLTPTTLRNSRRFTWRALSVLLVGLGARPHDVFGKFRRRRLVHHGVGVFHTDAVRAIVGLHDVHDRIVGVPRRPIALPLEHHGERGDRLRAGLDHALHRVVVGELTHVAAAILDDVDVVAVVNGLHGRKGNARLRPQPGQHDLLPTALLDRGHEVLVVPRVHGRTFDRYVVREHGLDLWPEIPAEARGFDGGEHEGDLEHACGLRERHGVIDDGLAVEVGDAEEHLGLKVDERDDAVVRCQEPLFAELRPTLVLSHDYLLVKVG